MVEKRREGHATRELMVQMLRMARERVSDLIFLVGQEIARYLENNFIDVIILMISATSSVHISNLSIAMASMVVTDAAIAR